VIPENTGIDWVKINDTVTIEWVAPTIGAIRFHYDELPPPNGSQYRGSCLVKIIGQTYVFMLMVFEDKKDPLRTYEHRDVRNYLESEPLFLIPGRRKRIKNGKLVNLQYKESTSVDDVDVKSEVNSSNVAHNAVNNCGAFKMENTRLVVTMDLQDKDGVSQADVVATFKTLDYPQTVAMQKAVVGAITGLGDLNVATKAAEVAA
jgi:hypothetical protein